MLIGLFINYVIARVELEDLRFPSRSCENQLRSCSTPYVLALMDEKL